MGEVCEFGLGGRVGVDEGEERDVCGVWVGRVVVGDCREVEREEFEREVDN